jgi:hypothetical protein
MRALLRFDLSDPDDAREHRYALAGRDALIALERIDQHCRNLDKYTELSDETAAILKDIRGMIPYDLLELLSCP